MTLGLTFTACSSDDDDDVIVRETTAEKASAGTYTGTWTRVKASDSSSESYDGTVTLEATENVGVTSITFACPSAPLTATSAYTATAVANVWYSNNGFQFTNNVATNGLGTAFVGRISDEGVLTTTFTVNLREGRSTTTYYYSFEGVR